VRRSARVSMAMLSGLVAVPLCANAAGAVAPAAPDGPSCTPAYQFIVQSHSNYFIESAPLFTHTAYNGGGATATESYSESNTYSTTATYTASVNVGESIIIAGISASVGASLAKGYSGGGTLTDSVSTPAHWYAHFETGAFGYTTGGYLLYTSSGCVQTDAGSVSNATANKAVGGSADVGIDSQVNATA
jgi:hypothetical protein